MGTSFDATRDYPLGTRRPDLVSTPGGVAVTYWLGLVSIYGGVALMAVGAWRLQAGQR